jgi:hypothetical protein
MHVGRDTQLCMICPYKFRLPVERLTAPPAKTMTGLDSFLERRRKMSYSSKVMAEDVSGILLE